MKPKFPLHAVFALLCIPVAQVGAQTQLFLDQNGAPAGLGVTGGSTYNWTATGVWSTTDLGNVTTQTWTGSNERANFNGAGTGTNYTVTVGASDNSSVTVQSLGLNLNNSAPNYRGTLGDVTLGQTSSGTIVAGNATTRVWVPTGTLTINSTLSLGSNALVFSGGNVTANGPITGTGAVSLASNVVGAGTVTMAGANSYSGATSVNPGFTLKLDYSGQNNSKLSNTAALTLRGKLELVGGTHTEVVSATTLSAGASSIVRNIGSSATVALNAITRNSGATLNLPTAGVATTDTNNTNGILGGYATIAGTDWATTVDSGAADTAITAYTGYTSDTWGTGNNTDVTSSAADPAGDSTTNSLRFNSAGTKTVTLAGINTLTSGGILMTAANGGAVTIGGGTLRGLSNGDLIVHQHNTTNALTINSVIADNGTAAAITKTGAGTLVLGGANTNTGSVQVNEGVLSVSSNANFGSETTGAQVLLNGGTLRATGTFGLFNGTAGTNNRNLGLITTSTVEVTGANTLTVANNTGGNAGLNKTGTGTLLFTGTATWSDRTNVAEGTLELRTPSGTNTLNGPLTGAGTIRVSGTTGTQAFSGDLSGFTGTIEHVNSGNSLSFTGPFAAAQDGSNAKFALSGATSGSRLGAGATGFTTFKMGELSGTGGFIQQLVSGTTFEIGNLNTNSTFAGVFGTGAVNKVGTGTLTLSGANTTGENKTVTRGKVVLLNNQSTSNGSWLVSPNNTTAAELQIGASDQTGATTVAVTTSKEIRLGQNGYSGSASASLTAIGNGSFATSVTNASNLNIFRSGTVTVGSGATWNQSGNLVLRSVGGFGAALVVNSGGSFNYTGANAIDLGYNNAALDSGSSRVTLAGGNFTTGQAFQMVSTTSTTSASYVELSGGGKITLSATVAALTTGGDEGVNFRLGTGGGIVNTATFSTTIGHAISNVSGQTGSLTKEGGGTLTLSVANTYTGNTTITGGTLALTGTGSISASPVISVKSGATLDVSSVSGGWSAQGSSTSNRQTLTGSGGVTGATTIGGFGTHNAGDGVVGSQAFSSSLTYASGSIFEWDLATSKDANGAGGNDGVAGMDFDSVTVAGNLEAATTGAIFKVIFGTAAQADITNPANTFWNTAYGTQTWNMSAIFGKDFTTNAFTSVQTSTNVSTFGSFTISGTALTWTAVPEPTSALAGLLITAGLLRRRRA